MLVSRTSRRRPSVAVLARGFGALGLALLLTVAASAQDLKVGQRVLARWNVDNDVYHYPGTVAALDGDMVEVAYDDGSKGRQPRPAVLARVFVKGDFVRADGKSAVVESDGPGAQVTVRPLSGGDPYAAPRAKVIALLRNDHALRDGAPLTLREKTLVMAKWDQRSWYAGTLNRLQGEGALIHFADGSWKWVPQDHITTFPPPAGTWVEGVNKRDGQAVPAKFVSADAKTVKLRFFAGEERTLPVERLVWLYDQPGLDYDGALEARAPTAESDRRPHAKTLWGWLTPRLHYYDPDQLSRSSVVTDPNHLELVFCVWSPKDRPLRKDWKRVLDIMAEQTRAFLARELPGVTVEARSAPAVTGEHPLEWYKKNLNENDAWRIWQPTGESAKVAFPDGAKAGRHRVVVVLPDAPGISSDSSGFERGIGYVRMKGQWFEGVTLAGLEAAGKTAPASGFDEWKEDYIATTLAHEVLHTIGLPHTDGNPWEVMNIGPWYPITRREVHIAQKHKIALRAPFVASLSLSQGFAQYLCDPAASYLGTIAATPRADTRVRLQYAKGKGFFKLRETLGSFAKGTVTRGGDRKFTGDRTICRAYLASFVHYMLERGGPAALEALFKATETDAADVAARHLKTTVPDLERAWHGWLRERTAAPAPVGAGSTGKGE